jgi:thiol:disulfide interchange protein
LTSDVFDGEMAMTVERNRVTEGKDATLGHKDPSAALVREALLGDYAIKRGHSDHLADGRPQTDRALKPIEWQTDINQAFLRAQKEHKPVIAMFQEDYCAWCRKMEGEMGKGALARLADQAVFLKVSPSQSEKGAKFASALGVNAFPSVVAFDIQNGKIKPLARITGYLDPQKLASELDDAIGKVPGNKQDPKIKIAVA